MNPHHRWDEWDRWERRPIRPLTYLCLVFLISLSCGILASFGTGNASGSPALHTINKATPILFGTKVGTTGGGDGNFF